MGVIAFGRQLVINFPDYALGFSHPRVIKQAAWHSGITKPIRAVIMRHVAVDGIPKRDFKAVDDSKHFLREMKIPSV